MTDALENELFLIEKQGLYYRPESAGYTGLKSEAGRYSFDFAAMIVGPNGPEGSQDGMSMWAESEAPDYSSGCAWDVVMKDKAYKEGYAAAVLAERERMNAALELAISIGLSLGMMDVVVDAIRARTEQEGK